MNGDDTSFGDGALHYGRAGIDRLYARIWGDSIHFGIYETPATSLEAAVVESKRLLSAMAELAPGKHVLEVASGWGATARYLARAHGVRVTASNHEADHLITCRTLAMLHGLDSRINCTWADFQALPFADAAFDVWWCQEAIVHAQDKAALFAEAYRVLRPGGRIVFSDQTTERDLCSRAVRARLSARHGSGDLFSAAQFMSALGATGFTGLHCIDRSAHMRRHFANLVQRMDDTMDVLCADFSEAQVHANHALWNLGLSLSESGAIGWHFFYAEKPG